MGGRLGRGEWPYHHGDAIGQCCHAPAHYPAFHMVCLDGPGLSNPQTAWINKPLTTLQLTVNGPVITSRYWILYYLVYRQKYLQFLVKEKKSTC